MTQLHPTVQRPAERFVDGVKRTTAAVRGRLRPDGATLLPSVVIIGGQRCGTTSLYSYLSEHPSFRPALVKEVHYFDTHFHHGLDWYLGHFPRASSVPPGVITGEASPYYLLHPAVPARLQAVLPDATLLVLLRDPVERALSHHRHEVAKGHETLSFRDAVAAEDERVQADLARLAVDDGFTSFAAQHYSYVTRGMYAEQLERWEAVVGRDRLKVINADVFFADPDTVYNRVLQEVGLPPHHLSDYVARNTYRRSPMDEDLRSQLAERFAPSNARLGRWMGDEPLGWTEP